MSNRIRYSTSAHLAVALWDMPRKEPPLWAGCEAREKHYRQAKRDRNAIARYYRVLRVEPECGPAVARKAHRQKRVVTGQEARRRLNRLRCVILGKRG